MSKRGKWRIQSKGKNYIFITALLLGIFILLIISYRARIIGRQIGNQIQVIEQIDDCRILSESNVLYRLTKDVAANGTCFSITAPDVALDCQGYQILFAETRSGYGVYGAGAHRLGLTNCRILEGNSSVSKNHGIFLNVSDGGVISNNSLFTRGGTARGVYILSGSNWSILENKISVFGNYGSGILITSGSYNLLWNNTINKQGNISGYGVYIAGSSHENSVYANNITTSTQGSHGIYLSSSSGSFMDIQNNTISTFGNDSHGISVFAVNSTFHRNIIRTNAENASGIFLSSVADSTISRNSIRTLGNSSYGIYLQGNAFGNFLLRNTFRTFGSDGYGIYLDENASLNNFVNNTILTFGDERGYGILVKGFNNTFTLNNITTSGLSRGYGMVVAGSSNAFYNTTILTFGEIGLGTTVSESSNTFYSHVITTYGNSSSGVRLRGILSTVFQDLNVQTYGTSAYGLFLRDGINDFVLTDSILNAAKSEDYLIWNDVLGGNWNFTHVNYTDILWKDGGNGTLNIQRRLSLFVYNDTGAPVEAEVQIVSDDGTRILRRSSGGILREDLLDYRIINSTRTEFYSHYSINVSAFGYHPFSTEVVMNDSKEVRAVLRALSVFPLTACGVLNESRRYILVGNVASSETCFLIQADHAVLEGDGYSIISSADSGYGIYINESNRVSLSNVSLVAYGNNSVGVLFWNSSYGEVDGVGILTTGSASHGISLSKSSVDIVKSSINTSGSGSHGVYALSSSGSIVDSVINASGMSGRGIDLQGSSIGILRNIISTSQGNAVHVSSGRENQINNNSIISSGASEGYGIFLGLSSGVYVVGNSILSRGDAGAGIVLMGTQDSFFSGNQITTFGADGIAFYENVSGNVFSDSYVNASVSHDAFFSANSFGAVNFTNVSLSDAIWKFEQGGNASIYQHWYYAARIVDNTSQSPLEGVDVRLSNALNSSFSKMTDRSGIIGRIALLSLYEDSNGIRNYSPYRLLLTKRGYATLDKEIGFSFNREDVFEMTSLCKDVDGDGYNQSVAGCGIPDCDDDREEAGAYLTCIRSGSCEPFLTCASQCPALPQEICDNGVDDNCNGNQDEACPSPLPAIQVRSPENKSYLNQLVRLIFRSNASQCWYVLDGVSVSSSCAVESFLRPVGGDHLSPGEHNLVIFANGSSGLSKVSFNFSVAYTRRILVNYDEFQGKGETTRIHELSDAQLENVSLILHIPGYGKMVFFGPVNLTRDAHRTRNESDLDIGANISLNRIEVNLSILSSFNRGAKLFLEGLGIRNPRILRDGAVCQSPQCIFESYSNGVLVFNVSGFSLYSAEEDPSIPTDGDDNGPGGSPSGSVPPSSRPGPPISISEARLLQGVQVNRSKGEEVSINLFGKTSSVVYQSLSGNTLQLLVRTPNQSFTFSLSVGDVESVDLNDDKERDLLIRLDGLRNSTALLYFKKIALSPPQPGSSLIPIGQGNLTGKGDEGNVGEESRTFFYILIGVIFFVLIVIVILLLYLFFHKKEKPVNETQTTSNKLMPPRKFPIKSYTMPTKSAGYTTSRDTM